MMDPHARRWFGVGRSSDSDSAAAGLEAAQQAMTGDDAKLAIVFASDAHDTEGLLRAIRSATGHIPLIGCSTAGEIASAGPGDSGVVVTVLGGPGFTVEVAAADTRSHGLRAASAEVAACAEKVPDAPHRVLMLLSDGLAGDQQEVVRGAYSRVGASIPLVGGCAGDDLRMKVTHQLFGDSVLTGAIVAAAIGSEAPMGIGVQHGWQRVGEPMLVTRSAGNHVYELDDEPALDVYLNRLDVPDEIRNDPAKFTRFASTHPLGLSRRSGEEVRFVAEANIKERSLVCVAAVPQGGFAWLMEGDCQSVLSATDSACNDALNALNGQPPLGMLAFDCIARRGVLGEEGIVSEVRRIGELACGAPVAGFYTYGEFARTHGVTGFHNQTLVVLAVG